MNEYIQLRICTTGYLDMELDTKFFNKLASGCYNNEDVAQKLLDVNFPFPAVIIFKNAELTKLMLDQGCLVDSRLLPDGKTALHLAVELLNIDNVKVLIDHGADVNARDVYNRMPLHRFQMRPDDADEKLEILKILIEKGASLTATSNRLRDHYYLNDPGLSVQSKLLAEGDIRTLRLLFSYIDILKKDVDGKTPLHHLVKNKNPGVLEVLRGKTLCINARDSDERTPLDIAVFRGDLEKVRFLLKIGANPNNLDKVGNPTLRYILINLPDSEKVRNVIELLLLYGVNPRILTRNHDTSIALGSAMERDYEFAKLLLAHLAKFESFGVPLNKFIVKKIKSNFSFEDYFYSCQQQIDRMKMTTVYESITLYKLLSESQKKLNMYARNEQFLPYYEFVKSNKYNIYPYYVNSIIVRFDKAIFTAKVKNKAASMICQICKLPLSMTSTIAYKIVEYLSPKDLESLCMINDDAFE